MQLEDDGFFHLTYCTNIHPGEGWDEVFANLRKYAPALKSRLAPRAPFGLGLRLSAAESAQLLEGDQLPRFRAFLDEHALYVAIINGFPYGSFHRQVIKEDVFAPDWRQEERVAYTLQLVRILQELLPAGLDGGISTLPLSYKRWIGKDSDGDWERITKNVVRVVHALVQARGDRDRVIHLDLEPEPDGLLENSAEVVAFYRNWLLPVGGPLLAESLTITLDEARQFMLDHVRVCFDTCHFAVEYEEPKAALDRLTEAGIRIGRFQISSALRVVLPLDGEMRGDVAEQLGAFAESTYLHQVIEKQAGGSLNHYPDLIDALPMIKDEQAQEWRIHFHVPLFAGEFGLFGATQDYIRAVFRLLRETRCSRHLEIETYTWEVLPAELKQIYLSQSIESTRG